MMGLPYQTHRSLIEPLTGQKHIRKVLLSRFLGFMDKITKSGKKRLNMLMETCKKDVRYNYRNSMLLLGKTSVSDVRREDVDSIEYFKLEPDESWKVDSIKELIEVKQGKVEVPGFDKDELDTILDYLCTS